MAIFRHNLISTQARNRPHTTRHSAEWRIVNSGIRAKLGENLSSIAHQRLSLENSPHSAIFSLDNRRKRMYLGRNACSTMSQWSCGVVRQKHGGSINWKSPSRVGLTFRTWWRYWGACCCAPDLSGPLDSLQCRVVDLEMSLEGFHRARGDFMKQAPHDPEHCCRRNAIAGGAA